MYNEEEIYELYSSNLSIATRKLTEIEVFCGNKPSFGGLNGWVYEQTIQYCIKKELEAKKVKVGITEQARLQSRIKADLRIGHVAIEIKQSGLFSIPDVAKYGKYRQAANGIGLEYLFVTGGERYQPYRDGITKALGKENTFFLDTDGEWNRFINRLTHLLRQKPAR